MTLSATPAVDRYTADGSQTVFDYKFKILDAAHLQVFFGNVVQGSGFTISGVNNDTGGTVTFDVAPTNGMIVTLRQEVPLDQPSALPNQGPFPSQTVETQIADRIVMQNKQQQEELNRSVKVAVSSTLTDLDLTPDPGKVLAWSQDGDEIIGAELLPDATPVSVFGATLVDDADAPEALGTLGFSDYVKNNLIASASADAHLATLLPAIDTVLESITSLVDVGVFHPAMDEHPAWYDGVTGARSRFMMATARTAGGNSTVKIWDLTVATPVVLQTITLNNSVVSAISDIKGGVIAIASDDGLYRRGWTRAGFGAIDDGLPDPISTHAPPVLTSNNLVDVCIGYSDQPVANPATGGKTPTIGFVYGAGGKVAGLLKDDGNLFDVAGNVGNVGCAIDNGHFIHPNGATITAASPPISTITSDNWTKFNAIQSSTGNPHGFVPGNDIDAQNGMVAGGGADGLTLVTSPTNYDDGAAVISAKLNRAYTTGWMPRDIRGAWLANGKTDDRCFRGNNLTQTGVVTETDAATGAELKAYAGFSSSKYLFRGDDPDYNALGAGANHMAVWFKSDGNSAIEFLFGLTNAATTVHSYLRLLADGTLQWTFAGASGGGTITSMAALDDGDWHRADCVCRADGDRELYVDGLSVGVSATAVGSLNGTILAHIGALPAGANPAGTSLMSLARLSATAPSPAQVRFMVETERRLFAANARCLLQGGADAVQSVAIDPVTSDLFVGQADSLQRFEGLLMAEERLPAGENWTSRNHKAIRAVAGALLLVNDVDPPDGNVESYASVPAIDLRDELAGVVAAHEPPRRPDLSRAAAWATFNGESGVVIDASFNIKSITRTNAGAYTIAFAVPFKYPPAVLCLSGQPGSMANSPPTSTESTILLRDTTEAPADSNTISFVAFGELANE